MAAAATMVAAAAMLVSATAAATVPEVMATVEAVEADMAPVGCMEVESVMANPMTKVVERAPEATGRAVGAAGWMVQEHVEEGWAMRMVGGVATVSGAAFGLAIPGACALRLSYGMLAGPALEEALERLGGGLRALLRP